MDQSAIKRYTKRLNISDDILPQELLVNLGVGQVKGDKFTFNAAGILFFAQHPTKYFPHSVVDCVAYKNNNKVYIIDRKIFDFDLMSNIENSVAFVLRYLKLAYEIKGLIRKEILEIPEVALREAIVNAVMHRDYFERGANVMVEIFDNRVEISNPGGLIKGLKPEDFGRRTLARNPLIAALLHRIGYIEKLATGIQRIRRSMEEANLPEPVFEFNTFFTVTLIRFNSIREIQQELSTTEDKAVRIIAILGTMIYNKGVKPEKIAKELDITARTIRNDLNTLQLHGWVYGSGATKVREYELSAVGKARASRYL